MTRIGRCIALVCALVERLRREAMGEADGDFKQSVDASVAVVGAYYTALNTYERELYIESAYLDPTQEVLWDGHDNKILGRHEQLKQLSLPIVSCQSRHPSPGSRSPSAR